MSKMISPFDISTGSILIDFPGSSPTATDLRGTAAINSVREFGALEYDFSLDINSETAAAPAAAYVIGENCDIVLIHPSVHGGEPYGFIISPDPSSRGSGISIQKEYDQTNDVTLIYIFFQVVMADDLKNPDGSEHTESRSTMYAMLLDYLAQVDQIAIDTNIGTFTGIGTVGHTSTELHMVNGSMITCKFANVSEYHAPIDPGLFFGSIWQDTPPAVGALTWDTSVWR